MPGNSSFNATGRAKDVPLSSRTPSEAKKVHARSQAIKALALRLLAACFRCCVAPTREAAGGGMVGRHTKCAEGQALQTDLLLMPGVRQIEKWCQSPYLSCVCALPSSWYFNKLPVSGEVNELLTCLGVKGINAGFQVMLALLQAGCILPDPVSFFFSRCPGGCHVPGLLAH